LNQLALKNGDGMLMNIKAIRVADVTDGTSNTLFVGEVTGGGPGSKRGFEWIDGDIFTTHLGINGAGTLPGDGTYLRNTQEVGFSSYHPGGCIFVLVDSSVQFLSQIIDSDLLRSLTTRASISSDNQRDILVSGPP
jgi:hypothetical protein